MKASLGELHKNWPRELCEYSVVAEIHDEIIADVPKKYAKEIAKIIQKTMERMANEMCPGVRFMASATVCSDWSQGK